MTVFPLRSMKPYFFPNNQRERPSVKSPQAEVQSCFPGAGKRRIWSPFLSIYPQPFLRFTGASPNWKLLAQSKRGGIAQFPDLSMKPHPLLSDSDSVAAAKPSENGYTYVNRAGMTSFPLLSMKPLRGGMVLSSTSIIARPSWKADSSPLLSLSMRPEIGGMTILLVWSM